MDSGIVEIAVLEGQIAAVQVVTAQEVRLRDAVVQAHTAGLTQAQPVLQPEVERQLLLLNDIPGVVARGTLTPGASTGTADVVVSVAEDEPLALRVQADNHGSRSSGEYRAGLQMQLRDLSGWGDATTLQATVSNGGGLVSGSIGTRVPVGGDGWHVGASLSRLTYDLSGDFAALGATGVATTASLSLEWPMVRRMQANLWLEAAMDYKRLNDEVRLIGQENQRASRLGQLSARGDLQDGLFGGGASVASAALWVGELRAGDAGRSTFKRPSCSWRASRRCGARCRPMRVCWRSTRAGRWTARRSSAWRGPRACAPTRRVKHRWTSGGCGAPSCATAWPTWAGR